MCGAFIGPTGPLFLAAGSFPLPLLGKGQRGLFWPTTRRSLFCWGLLLLCGAFIGPTGTYFWLRAPPPSSSSFRFLCGFGIVLPSVIFCLYLAYLTFYGLRCVVVFSYLCTRYGSWITRHQWSRLIFAAIFIIPFSSSYVLFRRLTSYFVVLR